MTGEHTFTYNEGVIQTLTKAGKRETKTFSKFELIVSHTARRSFATNAPIIFENGLRYKWERGKEIAPPYSWPCTSLNILGAV